MESIQNHGEEQPLLLMLRLEEAWFPRTSVFRVAGLAQEQPVLSLPNLQISQALRIKELCSIPMVKIWLLPICLILRMVMHLLNGKMLHLAELQDLIRLSLILTSRYSVWQMPI